MQELLWQSIWAKSQEDIRVDLSCETGEHTFRPCSLGGSKENVSFSKVTQNALLKGDWLRLIGNAFMELGSPVSIEMMGLWNNRGHSVFLTIGARWMSLPSWARVAFKVP